MTFSEETVMAYADGELDAATRAAIEAAMATDPELTRRIAQHRALRQRLSGAFDAVLAEPLPERLLAAARGDVEERRATVVPLKRAAAVRWSWREWSALAASLALGALLGPWLMRVGERTPLLSSDGAVPPRGMLAHALSEQLASNQPAAAPVQIGVSFRSRTGAYCRTFVLRDKNPLAGLACHERGGWQVEALARAESASAGAEYRAAGSALPAAIAGTLDAMIAGEPLDERGEAAARANGWGR
jgi:hypothetical protein